MTILSMNAHTSEELIAFALEAAKIGGDQGAGLLFQYMFGGRLVYDRSTEEWFVFAGAHWERDVHAHAQACVLDAVAQIFTDAAEQIRPDVAAAEAELEAAGGPKRASVEVKQRCEELAGAFKKIKRLADDLRNVPKAAMVLQAAAGLPGMSVAGGEWDSDPWLLAVANGVIDLQTGDFRAGRPEDRITKVAPVIYDPSASCPDVEVFLASLFEDSSDKEAVISFLFRLFGYMMTGSVREHVLPIWYGDAGRNGKGTLQRLLAATLGPYIGTVSKSVLLKSDHAKQSGAADADQYSLLGKRGVFANETNQGDALDPGMVKTLTGGDTIAARPPYGKRVVEFAPTHKVVLVTNHKPYLPVDDDALWKRVIYIPFTITFVPNPQKPNERLIDHGIEDRMRQQTSGFLNLLIAGCLSWQRDGLNPPACLLQATDDTRSRSDTIGRWLDEVAVVHDDARWPVKNAFECYREWLRENGHRDITSTTFADAMEKRGFVRRKSSAMVWLGVGPCTVEVKIEPLSVIRLALEGRIDDAYALSRKLGADDQQVVLAAIGHMQTSIELQPEAVF